MLATLTDSGCGYSMIWGDMVCKIVTEGAIVGKRRRYGANSGHLSNSVKELHL